MSRKGKGSGEQQPSVTCTYVLLKYDGTTEEKTAKMSPGWEISALGAQPTLIGMFEAMDVIVLGIDMEDLEDEAKVEDLKQKKNQHVLPEPFENDEEIFGDMILYKMNGDSDPCDFSLADWEEYVKDPKAQKFLEALEAREKEIEALENEDDDDDEDDEEEDDEDDDDGEDDDDDGEEDEDNDDEDVPPKGKRRGKDEKDASPAKKRK